MEDLVDFLIQTLFTHWNTDNYDPLPTLVNQRDSQPYEQTTDGLQAQPRTVDVDLADTNVISVGTSVTRDTEPLDLSFNIAVDAAVGCRIEGVHGDEWGHVAGAADFTTLIEEAKRAIWAERKWPIRTGDTDGFKLLEIGDETDRSVADKDYYRYDLTVGFQGYETLP